MITFTVHFGSEQISPILCFMNIWRRSFTSIHLHFAYFNLYFPSSIKALRHLTILIFSNSIFAQFTVSRILKFVLQDESNRYYFCSSFL